MENKKRIVGRYTLVLEDSLKEKFQHRFDEYNNSVKVPLAYIDELTTRFNDENGLFEFINSHSIIKCDYKKAYITYQQYKRIKTLPVVFNESADLCSLAKLKDSKISIDNRTFMSVSSRFLNKIHDNYYKHYFIRNTEDQMLVKYIKDYTQNSMYGFDSFNKDKIKDKLASYKQCREVILSMNEYDKQLRKMRER